ncbi:hypothetical protein LCGC14_2325880 [marine sediment metagenome]|uniref:Uncharacterized protein n=1 Tax=marine sediment metagenome TaxID=412755 RepID=A0A0F9CH20_9ZZZZ
MKEKRKGITIFNYLFNLSILILGIFLLIFKINIFAGIWYTIQGALFLILIRLSEIWFRKRIEEIDKNFEEMIKRLEKRWEKG